MCAHYTWRDTFQDVNNKGKKSCGAWNPDACRRCVPAPPFGTQFSTLLPTVHMQHLFCSSLTFATLFVCVC